MARVLERVRGRPRLRAVLSAAAEPSGVAMGEVPLRLSVRNLGDRALHGRGILPVKLRVRWLAADGASEVSPPRLVRVPGRVAAGATAEIECRVAAPNSIGRYLIEAQLVAASADVECPIARIPCRVTGFRPATGGKFDYRDLYGRADLDQDHWTVVGPATREEFELLSRGKVEQLRALGLGPESRVLDIGCGTGMLARALVDHLRAPGMYYGTDIIPAAIEFCRKTYAHPGFHFLVNEMTSVPIQDQTFDVIVLSSVFTHVFPDEMAALLRELKRLLAPAGFVLADAFTSDTVADYEGDRGMVVVNGDGLRRRIADAGLVEVEVESMEWTDDIRRRILQLRHATI